MEKDAHHRYAAHLLSVSLEIICPNIRIIALEEHPAGYTVQASFNHTFSHELIEPLEKCMQELHEGATKIMHMVPESAAGYLQKLGQSKLAKEAKNSKKQVLNIVSIGPKVHLEPYSLSAEWGIFSILEARLVQKKHEKVQFWEFVVRSFQTMQEKNHWKKIYAEKKKKSFAVQAKNIGWIDQVEEEMVFRERGLEAKRKIELALQKAFHSADFEEILIPCTTAEQFKKLTYHLDGEAFFSHIPTAKDPFDTQVVFSRTFFSEEFVEEVNSFLLLWREIFKMLGIDTSVTLTGRKSSLRAKLCRGLEKNGIPFVLDETKSSMIKIVFFSEDIWEHKHPLLKACFDLRSDTPLLWGEFFSIKRILTHQVESESS